MPPGLGALAGKASALGSVAAGMAGDLLGGPDGGGEEREPFPLRPLAPPPEIPDFMALASRKAAAVASQAAAAAEKARAAAAEADAVAASASEATADAASAQAAATNLGLVGGMVRSLNRALAEALGPAAAPAAGAVGPAARGRAPEGQAEGPPSIDRRLLRPDGRPWWPAKPPPPAPPAQELLLARRPGPSSFFL
ncbi:unnamed protein product [Prorocentrum cordatum]|uniref:Uncharacterized protein n=1 Tax=Prorocentrum cordatum TaxID=2364126 RepID=A0ABN9PT18_9DINO|nr:unnamed protein product [Polarella glacialis]